MGGGDWALMEAQLLCGCDCMGVCGCTGLWRQSPEGNGCTGWAGTAWCRAWPGPCTFMPKGVILELLSPAAVRGQEAWETAEGGASRGYPQYQGSCLAALVHLASRQALTHTANLLTRCGKAHKAGAAAEAKPPWQEQSRPVKSSHKASRHADVLLFPFHRGGN